MGSNGPLPSPTPVVQPDRGERVFMPPQPTFAIMDVQIVAGSLTQIQAGLSVSADEIVWVRKP